MGVVKIGGYYRRAKNSDGRIDGIALTNATANNRFLLMTKGRTTIQGYFHSIYFGTDIMYYNMNDSAKFGIDPLEDGKFKINQEPYVLRKTYDNSCEII